MPNRIVLRTYGIYFVLRHDLGRWKKGVGAIHVDVPEKQRDFSA